MFFVVRLWDPQLVSVEILLSSIISETIWYRCMGKVSSCASVFMFLCTPRFPLEHILYQKKQILMILSL